MRNTALTTDITERGTNKGWCKRRGITGMYVFLELCTQTIQLQLSAGPHNRNTACQIWPNMFSVSDWLSSSNVLCFTFKNFYLPSPQNSPNRWWVTFLYNSPSLLGSPKGERIHCKKPSNAVFHSPRLGISESSESATVQNRGSIFLILIFTGPTFSQRAAHGTGNQGCHLDSEHTRLL